MTWPRLKRSSSRIKTPKSSNSTIRASPPARSTHPSTTAMTIGATSWLKSDRTAKVTIKSTTMLRISTPTNRPKDKWTRTKKSQSCTRKREACSTSRLKTRRSLTKPSPTWKQSKLNQTKGTMKPTRRKQLRRLKWPLSFSSRSATSTSSERRR